MSTTSNKAKELMYINATNDGVFAKVNSKFVRTKVAILSCSQIANGTGFVKEYVNKALGSLDYAPVVGYFNGEDFEGHGQEINITDNGVEYTIKTIPFGVVIKDTARWEMIKSPNGEYEEYLVADAYIYRRCKKAAKKVMENKCNQSMEISVLNGEDKEDYYEIHDFEFEALCILGEDVTPAFNLAKIRTSDCNFAENAYQAMFNEMKEDLKDLVKIYKKDEDDKMSSQTTNEFEVKYNDLNTKYTDLSAKYDELDKKYSKLVEDNTSLQADYDALKSENSGLVEYKEKAEAEKRTLAEEKLFAQFEEIKDLESFKKLKEDAANYSLEDLEMRCYSILGKFKATNSEKVNNKEKSIEEKSQSASYSVDYEYEDNKSNTFNSVDRICERYKRK